MTPYYSSGGVTIYNAKCEYILPTLSNISLVFTSPPYNLASTPWPRLGNWKPGDSPGGKSKWKNGSDGSGGVKYDAILDNMLHGAYVNWQHQILLALWETLTEDGAIYYNHKPRVIGAKLWLPLELNPGLPLRQIVIWARAGGMNFNPTAYVPTHEWVMVMAKPAFRLKSKGASGAGDVWRVNQKSNKDHPAPFPVELPRIAIDSTKPGVVLDPFMGCGTTLVAAKEQGRECVGVEVSERYCEVAAQRLESVIQKS